MPDFATFWNSKDQLSAVFRLFTLVSLCLTAVLGFMLYKLNDRIGEIQQRTIDAQGNQIGRQDQLLDRQNSMLEEQKNRLVAVNNGLSEAIKRSQDLILQNNDLKKSLEQVYESNGILQKKADDLSVKATAAARGVGDTYDFNGARRLRTAGQMTVIAGEELQVFKLLVEMHQLHRWGELLSASEVQITKTPTWLTPYLFAGVANANLGNVIAAKIRLQYVVDHAGGDPAYSDAQQILGQLPK